MTNTFTLIVAVLTVESSYLQEVERPTKNVPDTVQFWFAPIASGESRLSRLTTIFTFIELVRPMPEHV